MQIIVSGHGHFASGLESTVKLLAGQLKQVSYIDFTREMDEDALRQAFKKQLDQDPQAVFFCDLFGGTPFKQAVLLSSDYADTAVIAGGNIAALMEVALPGLNTYANAQELADKLLATSQAGLKKFKRHHVRPQNAAEDGI